MNVYILVNVRVLLVTYVRVSLKLFAVVAMEIHDSAPHLHMYITYHLLSAAVGRKPSMVFGCGHVYHKECVQQTQTREVST